MAVEFFGVGWFRESTKADHPKMSLSRINSCRRSVQVCPVFVKNSRAILYDKSSVGYVGMYSGIVDGLTSIRRQLD